MTRITLDAETFRALASTTRLTVLRALDERRKTLTEISRDLALNKATVHEHLALLTAAGLVRKRDDEGRKWIYYELTWTGQRILHPQETTTFNVLLGLSVAAAGGGVTMLGRALGWWFENKAAETAGDEDLRLSSAPENASADAASNQHASSASSTSTSTETTSGSPSSGQGAGAPAASTTTSDDALLLKDASEGGSAPAADTFFDDGGWLALALLGCMILFAVLAGFLHKKLRPKPLDAASAAAAEGKT